MPDRRPTVAELARFVAAQAERIAKLEARLGASRERPAGVRIRRPAILFNPGYGWSGYTALGSSPAGCNHGLRRAALRPFLIGFETR